MKKLQNEIIDFDIELSHMLDYVFKTWNGDSDVLTKIVTTGFQNGFSQAKYWLLETTMNYFQIANTWSKERAEFLKNTDKNNNDNSFFDDISKISKNIMFNSMEYNRIIVEDFDFEKHTNKQLKELKPNLSNTRLFPKGWQEIKSSKKSAYDYFESFDLESDNLFEGHNSSSAGANSFNQRVNLAHVFYSDSEQRQNPLTTLYSAAFAHGLILKSHNNSLQLIDEIESIKAKYNNTDYPSATYLDNLLSVSSNKIFKALMVDKYINTKPYTSQIELDSYIENINESNILYGNVCLDLNINKSKYTYSGIYKIYSMEHFQNKIKESIKDWFSNEPFKEKINFEQIESSISFAYCSKDKFKALAQINNSNDNSFVIEYGDIPPFLSYSFPTDKELIKINADKTKKMLSSFMDIAKKSETTKTPSQTNIESLTKHQYKEQILSILNSDIPTIKLKP